MANNFDSNFTRKLMMKVADRMEANRMMSKMVDSQTYNGQFNPNTGDTIDIKRPTDYRTVRTSDGDLTAENPSDIITGKASAVVQDYISVEVEYQEAKEALEMGTDKDRFFDDIAKRIVIDLELDFAKFAMRNAGLRTGTPGNGVDSWAEIAEAGALMSSTGVPMNKDWCYFLNPYSQVAIANEQRSLGVNPEVSTATERAMVSRNYAGFDVYTATTLANYRTDVAADRVGTVAVNPDVTYLTAKDTMTQQIAVSGFGANLVIKAGETIEVTGRSRLNLATREVAVKSDGTEVVFTGTVVNEVTLDGSGAGTITITGPGIFVATGAYNTTDSAIVAGDVVTLGGAASTTVQPNLFWHPDAFAIAYVDMMKLQSTDTIYRSDDGLVMRCSKDSDVRANKQIVRFDLRPAYGVTNPFMAGQAHGTP
jgi:hypothetical protein